MFHLLRKLISEKSKKLKSFEQVANVSDARLRRLLRHVYARSRFYREYYSDHGIAASDIDHVRIEDLPFTSKEIIMSNFDQVACDPAINKRDVDQYIQATGDYRTWYKDRYKIIKTSGSSGSYGIFAYSRREWDILRVITITMGSYLKVSPFRKIKLAVIVDTRGLHAGISLMADIPGFFYDILIIDIYEAQSIINKKLNAFQPDILSGYANAVYLFAHEQLSSRLSIQPKQIGTSGEVLTDEARTTIRKAFGVSPINMYGASESVCMATSSLHCNNLHIAYDWNVLETVDASGRKMRNGDIGNAVLTNLYNYSIPLVRYKMNDMVSLHRGPCPGCGSVYPVIMAVEGRQEEIIRFSRPDGSEETLFPSFINFFDESNIKSYRVVQKERNRLEIQLLLANKEDSGPVMHTLDTRFRKLLLSKQLDSIVRYDFSIVDTLHCSEITGKFSHVITLEKYKAAPPFAGGRNDSGAATTGFAG